MCMLVFFSYRTLQIKPFCVQSMDQTLCRKRQAPLLLCAAIWRALIKSNSSHVRECRAITETVGNSKPDKTRQAVLCFVFFQKIKGALTAFHTVRNKSDVSLWRLQQQAHKGCSRWLIADCWPTFSIVRCRMIDFVFALRIRLSPSLIN